MSEPDETWAAEIKGRAASILCEAGALCGWPAPNCNAREGAEALYQAGLLAARSVPEAGKAVAWLPDPIGVNEIWQTVYDSLDLSEELRTECAKEVAAAIAKTFSSPLPRVRVAARAAYLLTKCADIFDANDFGADVRFEARQVAEALRNPADKEWLETFSIVVEGRLEDELAATLGIVSTELAPYSWDELLEIVRERLASVAPSGAEPAQAVPAEDVAGLIERLKEGVHRSGTHETIDDVDDANVVMAKAAAALTGLSAELYSWRENVIHLEAEATSLRRKLEESDKRIAKLEADLAFADERGAKVEALLEPHVQWECASEGCGKPATVHFVRGDVGSYYCRECYMRIQAIPAGDKP